MNETRRDRVMQLFGSDRDVLSRHAEVFPWACLTPLGVTRTRAGQFAHTISLMIVRLRGSKIEPEHPE